MAVVAPQETIAPEVRDASCQAVTHLPTKPGTSQPLLRH